MEVADDGDKVDGGVTLDDETMSRFAITAVLIRAGLLGTLETGLELWLELESTLVRPGLEADAEAMIFGDTPCIRAPSLCEIERCNDASCER